MPTNAELAKQVRELTALMAASQQTDEDVTEGDEDVHPLERNGRAAAKERKAKRARAAKAAKQQTAPSDDAEIPTLRVGGKEDRKSVV